MPIRAATARALNVVRRWPVVHWPVHQAARLMIRSAWGERFVRGVLGPDAQTDAQYRIWLQAHDTLTDSDRDAIRAHIARMTDPPVISVVMPAYATPAPLLRAAIEFGPRPALSALGTLHLRRRLAGRSAVDPAAGLRPPGPAHPHRAPAGERPYRRGDQLGAGAGHRRLRGLHGPRRPDFRARALPRGRPPGAPPRHRPDLLRRGQDRRARPCARSPISRPRGTPS